MKRYSVTTTVKEPKKNKMLEKNSEHCDFKKMKNSDHHTMDLAITQSSHTWQMQTFLQIGRMVKMFLSQTDNDAK